MMLKSARHVPLFVTVHKTPKEFDASAPRTQPKESFLKLLIESKQADKFIAPGTAYFNCLRDWDFSPNILVW
jgi:hypothetical protein